APRHGGAGQRLVERQKVKVRAAGVGAVGDGVGVAVGARVRVLEAAGAVDGRVGRHGEVGVDDGRVAARVVGAAVLGGDEVARELRQVGGTGGGVGGAGCVEGACDADEGLLGFEEG